MRAGRVVPGSQVRRYEQYPSPSQWVEGAVPAFMRQGDAVAVDRSSMHGTNICIRLPARLPPDKLSVAVWGKAPRSFNSLTAKPQRGA